jgi:hypothetical protein
MWFIIYVAKYVPLRYKRSEESESISQRMPTGLKSLNIVLLAERVQ